MRKFVVGIGLLGLLAGCSADWDQSSAHYVQSAEAGAVKIPDHRVSGVWRRPSADIADSPDRGDLVAYDRSRLPVQRGPYTWHPVQLSEAHALRAVVGGDLVVTGPNGQPIRLRLDRHIEHSDGNWTWIGREPGSAPGTEAIITFGPKAVFGTIPYGDQEPLRLMMSAGRAWLVETDGALIARMDNSGTRPREPDFLPAPRWSGASTEATGTSLFAGSAAAEATTTAAAAPTVDVVLGYTGSFAARLGGQSQALTRLTYLVDVTNQAYANSQVSAQLRLVRAQQVSYPDATSNRQALYDLTGVVCTEQAGGNLDCTQAVVPAALQPLHVARDRYGGDLVSLVRNFNDPENGGCGIAWLNGAGLTAITAQDAMSGLSVVSDSGGNLYPDGGYICRDETLAHELGHNMGSAHDRNTADGDDNALQENEYGAFPYSFGYKTTSGTGNFYTVMAYGDTGQARYRVFSNPAISACGGWPCGLPDQADNARSLRQTIPVVAAFRATTAASKARNDVDGDRRSDLLWFHPVNRVVVYWLMNGSNRVGSGSRAAPAGYTPLTTGDYNGDGRVDIVMGNGSAMQMWVGDGAGFSALPFRAYPTGWTLVASGDVDADGKADLLWFKASTRQFVYWVLNGPGLVRSVAFTTASGYVPLTSGDYNGDGRLDVLWRHSSAAMQLWTGNGNNFSIATAGTYPAGWTSLGSGDVNGDGKSDLLWYRPSQQKFVYWLRNGATTTGSAAQLVPAGYTFVASGDFSGDGQVDLDWKHSGGSMHAWLRTGNTYTSFAAPAYPAGWTPISGQQ